MSFASVCVTPERLLAVPEVRGVQLTKSIELRIVPPAPTTKMCACDSMTSERLAFTFENLAVHLTPSGDVTMVPLSPTATNCVSHQATRLRFAATPVD